MRGGSAAPPRLTARRAPHDSSRPPFATPWRAPHLESGTNFRLKYKNPLLSPLSLRSVALVSLVAWTSIALPARADAGGSLARLAALHADVASAHGPFAYVALRRLWAEWDKTDPNQIEEVLREVAADAAQPAPVRAYAKLLEAYARRRRGDLSGAGERVARLGYIGRWMALGPFDNDGKVGLAAAYEPEAEAMGPLNLAHDYDGKDHRAVRWRLLPAVSPYGWVDFGAFVRPEENVCVYATTFVREGRAGAARDLDASARATARPISIWAGAAGAMRISWNGAEVIADDKYRDLDSDRFAATVSLEPGWNRLTAKVCGDERRPMLSVRLATETGEADEHLDVDPDPAHSTPEGGAAKATGARRKPTASGVEGAVQAFERLIRGQAPAVLEAYARYLEATGADDPTEHRARELARKAAEKAPTIDRLLLAAAAAESRNQQATWIEKAEDLAEAGGASTDEAIHVLLARAEYARAGVNPRDAVPYYDRVLALDPDDVAATLAKVDLYEATGLRDTGLALLSRALLRSPESVGLLRAAVAALRDAGRDAEANEMAERYAALRFDDPSFIRARMDLAVVRRDAAGTAHWIERLLAANPDNPGSLQAAGQAWMRLGERTRALAMYRSALDIAPEDTDVMRQLAAAYGLAGEHDEQTRLLRRILDLMPQAKDVRDELSHMGPTAPRPDEQYARPSAEFLARRGAPGQGQARRSLVDLQVTTVFPNGLSSRFHQVVYQPQTDAAAAQ
jgi:tetratricopeptide (TPR) repeat protein